MFEVDTWWVIAFNRGINEHELREHFVSSRRKKTLNYKFHCESAWMNI